MGSFHDLPVELVLQIVRFVSDASHDPNDTAKYLQSPVITSHLHVDKDFWRVTLVRYRDLRDLALTCRELRPLAQEALFRSPWVDSSEREDGLLMTGFHRFLATLLGGPDLAKVVQRLHLDINPDVPTRRRSCLTESYVPNCVKERPCQFRKLEKLFSNFIEGIEIQL
jgi:hypothetical protein